MMNFVKLLGVIVVTVVVPLVILLAGYLGFLPAYTGVVITQLAVALSIIFILGGTGFLIYGDIKSKRYSKGA